MRRAAQAYSCRSTIGSKLETSELMRLHSMTGVEGPGISGDANVLRLEHLDRGDNGPDEDNGGGSESGDGGETHVDRCIDICPCITRVEVWRIYKRCEYELDGTKN